MKAKDRRLIATASLEEVEIDERSVMERMLDNISEVSDENDWIWHQLGEEDDYDFQLQKGRYTISVKLDKETSLIETSKLEVAIRSDIELFKAMREV